MNPLMALLLFACQEAPPQISPGDVAGGKWPLSGPAEVENDTELSVRARRVVRRWDPNLKMFTESLSDVGILRVTVTVAGKKFEGSVRAGTPGRYGINVSTEQKLLYSDKLALGALEPLFTRGPEDIKALLEIVEKAGSFLDEIERILSRQIDNSEKHRDDFLKRAAAWSAKVDELLEKTDLTGTANVLKTAMFHIRNVQVWEEKALPPASSNDPVRLKKKLFMDLDLTIEGLRKTLASVPTIISFEVKVSTSMILERLLTQAGDIERRQEAARAAARAASKLAEGVPIPDKDLVGLLDQAADRATDSKEIRDLLRHAGRSLIIN
jgi:hypothetical protein